MWASWCAPCRAELPYVQKLYQRFRNRSDIAILAFNVDDDPKAMTTALQELRVSIPSIAARDFAYSIVPAMALPANWISLPERQRCSWVTTTHTKRGSKALPLRLRRTPESEEK